MEKEKIDYLQELNPPQREGVVNTDGPTMIIAGAGSGKTRVLTYRIAHLIEKGVDPFSILALTFTNKAAKEMRQRVENVVGTDARSLWMGTFHSVFARILRAEADKLGYPSNFSILDTTDSKSLVKSIIKEMQLDDKTYKPNVVFNRISGAKNRLISWKEYNSNSIYRADDETNNKPQLGEIYKRYATRCFQSGAMDFDDLLFNTNILFKDHLDVLNKYQHRYRYVMVDEFQDTNISQYVITKKLAAVHQNICVVGDDAQSIYAFRGADIANILNFEKDYPDLKVIKLEQNYRSTQNIVNVANAVIANNQAQLHKSVWTQNEQGGLIDLIKATSDNEEGKLIASSIFEEKMQNQLRNSDFAILYRTNSQSRAIEEALRRSSIKYKIIGGLSFYQRKEIKDLVAYLRYSVNHKDETSLRRIINLPKRGIGEASVNKVIVAANEHNLPIWDVLCDIGQYLSGRAANAIMDFVTMIKRFRIEIDTKDAYEAAKSIANSSGLLKELYEDKTIEGLSRYENVQELLNAIKEFTDNPEVEDKSMATFLQEITLLTGVDQDDAKDNDEDKVTLMTIHMAKGLEFKYVYIVGMEENLFPSQMMVNSREDLEEERRLFYVAITRAEKKLTISHAISRYKYGKIQNNEPSRFLDEIDPSFINTNNKHHSTHQHAQSINQTSIHESDSMKSPYARNLVAGIKKQRLNKINTKKYNGTTHTPSDDFAPSDTSTLEEGMKVEHPKFGFGTVLFTDFKGTNKKAKVNFDNFGEKTLLLSFAKLKIH